MDVDDKYQTLLNKAQQHEQEHLFTFWSELSLVEQLTLLKQIELIDFTLMDSLFAKREQKVGLVDTIAPPDAVEFDETDTEVKELGEQALRKGKYAIFLLAGGQGSRLGFNGPKGCFAVTPLKNKTLFQLYAEKTLFASQKYGVDIDLYIMLGDHNYKESIEHFEQNKYFGLKEEQVIFFKQQGKMPAMDFDGKLLLADKANLFFAPNGTGDVYRSLEKAGILSRMKDKGIEFFHYVQIDDAMQYIADPYFIGHHIKEGADISLKAVEKTYPEEPVGLIVKDGKATRIAEYIYMPKEKNEERDDDGKLSFRAVNTAIHLMNRTFAEKAAAQDYVYYLSKKKVPYVNEEGRQVIPMEPNAYKFESFAFDPFVLAQKVLTFYVDREEHFGPVKNASGAKDKTKEAAQEQMIAQAKKWMIAAGVSKKVVESFDIVEISPTLAISEEDFVQAVKKRFPHLEEQLKGHKKVYLS